MKKGKKRKERKERTRGRVSNTFKYIVNKML